MVRRALFTAYGGGAMLLMERVMSLLTRRPLNAYMVLAALGCAGLVWFAYPKYLAPEGRDAPSGESVGMRKRRRANRREHGRRR